MQHSGKMIIRTFCPAACSTNVSILRKLASLCPGKLSNCTEATRKARLSSELPFIHLSGRVKFIPRSRHGALRSPSNNRRRSSRQRRPTTVSRQRRHEDWREHRRTSPPLREVESAGKGYKEDADRSRHQIAHQDHDTAITSASPKPGASARSSSTACRRRFQCDSSFTAHALTVPSAQPAAIVRPSGEQATLKTSPPVTSVWRSPPVTVSRILTWPGLFQSPSPEIRVSPFGENASDHK